MSRIAISIENKLKVIELLEQNTKYNDIVEEFGISKSAVSSIKKNKNVYLKLQENNANVKRIRHSRLGGEGKLIDDRLYKWCLEAKSRQIHITGFTLKKYALLIAIQLNMNSFKASNGWLSAFMKRHDIQLKKWNIGSKLRTSSVSDMSTLHQLPDSLDENFGITTPVDLEQWETDILCGAYDSEEFMAVERLNSLVNDSEVLVDQTHNRSSCNENVSESEPDEREHSTITDVNSNSPTPRHDLIESINDIPSIQPIITIESALQGWKMAKLWLQSVPTMEAAMISHIDNIFETEENKKKF